MKYTVIALSVQGKGKKIFNAGDVVTAENFPEGNIPDLIKNGFLSEGSPVKLESEELESEELESEELESEELESEELESEELEDQVILKTDELNKKQIIAKLKELRSLNDSVVFDANDDKQTLLDYLNSLV
jgi:hypothetical protein